MSTKSLRIVSVSRLPRSGQPETLIFKKGVNVIVGEPNTGKTRWLETIDFVLGDDSKAEEKLGEIIFNKYASAQVTLEIGDELITAQRRWHEAGAKTKIFVGDTSHDVVAFRQLLLDRLGIPSLHYPQGNPLGTRTWPELGWRSLFRHLYRRQRFWSDLADQQPASEQHACILQFLGIAEKLFSRQYGELVRKQKEIADLEAKREQFVAMLNEVSREIVSEEELDVAVTPEAIALATNRLKADITSLNTQRDALLTNALSVASTRDSAPPRDAVSKMTEEFASLKEIETKHTDELQRVRLRLSELAFFQQRVVAEIGRLERARTAGELLADLKVTHCPVCDQTIKRASDEETEHCYLCGQPTPTNGDPTGEPLKRLEFELEQLTGEKKEIAELVTSLSAKERDHTQRIEGLRNRAARLTELLRPVRIAIAPIIPPEVAAIDTEVGRRVERMDQLRRISESLARREKIAAEILRIQEQVQELMAEVAKQTAGLDFETASDVLSDAMNEYVTQLKYDVKSMWTQKDIQFSVKKEDFTVRVGRQKWASQLGGTMVIYFLLAYHYSLLKLSADDGSRIPAFLILDFPAEIEGEKVADHENFVIEPFITLSKKPGYADMQVIAAGSAFKGLQGAHRTELKEVWIG